MVAWYGSTRKGEAVGGKLKSSLYVIWGPKDAEDDQSQKAVLGVSGEQADAEKTMGEVLFRAAESHIAALAAGGSCSLFFTRGQADGSLQGSGSFVMNNPDGEPDQRRHIWEFEIQAVPVGEEEPIASPAE